jgi:hypothetical protein
LKANFVEIDADENLVDEDNSDSDIDVRGKFLGVVARASTSQSDAFFPQSSEPKNTSRYNGG